MRFKPTRDEGIIDQLRKSLGVNKIRTVQMLKMPDCDMCKVEGVKLEAKYDTKTVMGPHAYLCEIHYKKYGRPPTTKLEERVKIAVKSDKIPIVTVPLSFDSVIDVSCPHCMETRMVEPDANYVVTCESCENKYRLVSQI